MSDKVREIVLRRAAARQGLRLEKCRRRDPRAIGFGRYRLVSADRPRTPGRPESFVLILTRSSAGSGGSREPGPHPAPSSTWEVRAPGPRGPGGERPDGHEVDPRQPAGRAAGAHGALAELDEGRHVRRNSLTVGEHVAARIGLWWIGAGTASTMNFSMPGVSPHTSAGSGSRSWQSATSRPGTSCCARAAARAGKPLGTATVRAAHQVLSRALDEAVKHGQLVRNVARLERPPKGGGAAIETLDRDGILELFARLAGHPLHAIATLAMHSGARRGELLGLVWSDIDWTRGAIRIERALAETTRGVAVKPPKTRAGVRTLRLGESVMAMLHEHRREALEQHLARGLGRLPDDAPVFPAADGISWQSPRSLSVRWRRHRAVISMRCGCHASALISAGLDVGAVSRRLGHSNAAITLITYTHQFRQDDDRAVEATEALLAVASE